MTVKVGPEVAVAGVTWTVGLLGTPEQDLLVEEFDEPPEFDGLGIGGWET